MDVMTGIEKFVEMPDADKLEIIQQMRGFGIVGQSKAIMTAFLKAKKAANSNANVLIEGESGTGKELFSQAIHSLGLRSSGPMVKLNCAEIPETLLESELFGYEKGAFTGAAHRKIGKFELANNGTIFLDEISEMSLPLQSKLLRVIEDKTISRVGGLENIPINVRIVSATNRDLWQYVKKGQFREDLYYRLNVIYLHLPPLRDRREDVPILIDHFIRNYMQIENVKVNSIDEDVVKLLLSFNWFGNVRQLENIIHHTIIMTYDDKITMEDMPENISSFTSVSNDQQIEDGFIKKEDVIITSLDLEEMEKSQIIKALEKAHWKISEAARILGIHRNTLTQKIKKHNIK
jgi:transcriptional regulator with PAS, ATPase and Fis domain